eukprot:4110935-Pleurochrysis_carterae.AAC.1
MPPLPPRPPLSQMRNSHFKFRQECIPGGADEGSATSIRSAAQSPFRSTIALELGTAKTVSSIVTRGEASSTVPSWALVPFVSWEAGRTADGVLVPPPVRVPAYAAAEVVSPGVALREARLLARVAFCSRASSTLELAIRCDWSALRAGAAASALPVLNRVERED